MADEDLEALRKDLRSRRSQPKGEGKADKPKPAKKKRVKRPKPKGKESVEQPNKGTDPPATPKKEAEVKTGTETGTVAEPEPRTGTEPEPRTGTGTEPEPEPEPRTGTELEPEEEEEADAPLETKTDTGAKPEPPTSNSTDSRNVDPSPDVIEGSWYLPPWEHENNSLYQYLGDVRQRVESLDDRSISELEAKSVPLKVDSLNQGVYLGCLLSLGVAIEDLPLRYANNTLVWDGNEPTLDSIAKMSVKDVCEYATMSCVPELSADYKKETNTEHSRGPEYKTLSPYFLASDGNAFGSRFTITGLPSVQYSAKTVPIQDLQPSFETTAHVHRKTYQLMWMIDGDILRIFSATRAQLNLSVRSERPYLFYKLVE